MGDGKLRVFEVLEPRLQREDDSRQTNLWQNRIETNPAPPRNDKSPIDIGITWNKNVDLDIYVKADGDTELYYGRQSSEKYAARFLKDITTLPDSKGFETVTFTKETPLHNLQVFINHYAGTSNQPIDGEIRIRIDEKIYFKKFQLPSGSGTKGKGDRGNNPAWLTINIPAVVGI